MDNGTNLTVDKKGKLRRMIRYAVAVAASVLLIFVVIEAYKFYTLSPDKLYSSNYSAYELAPRPDSSDSASAIEEAYHEKQYDEVINLNRSSVLSIQDIFLTGIAYLEKRDYAKAISSFQVVIADVKDNKFALKDAAGYYLALAYLQNSDYDQAIELMTTIHNDPSHLYNSRFNRKYINKVKRLKWR